MGFRGVVVSVVVAWCVPAWAEPATIAVLPIQSLWTRPAEVTLVSEALVAAAGERDLAVRFVGDASGCGSDTCVGVDVVKTSSGRLHVRFRIVDTTKTVRDLGLVRSQPGSLRAAFRRVVTVLLDAAHRPTEPTGIPWPPLPPPDTVPPIPEPPADTGALAPPWYQTIGVNAFVSTAFTYNFNRPPSGTNGLRVFDDRHAEFTIDVAELVVQRAAENPSDAGFRVDLVAGSAIPRVSASAGLFRDDMGKAQDFDLQQAFASYIVPLGRGLRFDGGKFTTPAGAEVIDGYDGFGDHYSRSLLFGLAVPFTHTGVRVAYPFSDRVSLSALVTNGWDVVRDNNNARSFGGVLTLQPLDDLTIATTYLAGPETADDTETWRHLVDVVATWKLAPEVTVMLNGDWARDGDARWYGGAGYVRFDLTSRIAIATRGEVFFDRDAARTGIDQRVWEATLTLALRLAPGFLVRFESRTDRSTETVFPSRDGDRRSQITMAINATYAM